MRYLARLKLLATPQNEGRVLGILERNHLSHRVLVSGGVRVLEVDFEKGDPRLQPVIREIESIGEEVGPTLYEPVFTQQEVEESRILHLFIRSLCGSSFSYWAEELGLPPGTPVMDKRAMGRKDIALTYGFEVVISERLKRILEDERLTGWRAQPVLHRNRARDPFPAFFHLTSDNVLPPLGSETDLHSVRRAGPSGEYIATYQRGPLVYHARDIGRLQDFNRTSEKFGEATQAQPEMLISQRAWSILKRYKVRHVDIEPVVMIGDSAVQ